MQPVATTAAARAGAGEASLARRIVAAPRLSSAEAAHARVEEWLAEIAGTAAGRALARLLADHPTVKTLVAALADGSPYLFDLARDDGERLLAILASEPELRFRELIVDARRMIPAAGNDTEVMRLLRRMKAEVALLIGLADIGGVWPVMEVTRLQTTLADAAVGAAVDHLLAQGHRRGRLQLADPARPSQGSGYIVLAMGKMGSSELNYSSDIDLIVFYDADAPALVPGMEPGAFFVRPGEVAAGAHRRRLRVSHRSALAARSGRDPHRHLHRRGARLLREPRAELGARGADQGAALRR